MHLYRRGGEFSIRLGHHELMNSRIHASEDALASIALGRLADRGSARVLIGGLGMGFTLAAVLRESGPKCEVVVAELVPAVVEWNRGEMGGVAGRPLDDPRVRVEPRDVARVIAEAREVFAAILLDVDNGPAGLTATANDRLYTSAGLRRARTALRPGGLLAVWSAASDAAFVRRLRDAGFAADEIPVRGRGRRGGPRYVIWVGRRVGRKHRTLNTKH